MNLNTLFEQLAFGELSQHRVGKEGRIDPADYPMLISHVNHALTTLHSRLPLQQKELTLLQFDHITEYKLDARFATSNPDPTVNFKYIADSDANPFLDDVIRIQSAFDGEGKNVSINDEYDDNSWFTPNPDTIQIPYPVGGNVSAILYRANHVMLDLDISDPSTVTLDIPTVVETALAAHIASRVYVSLGNQTSAALSSFYRNIYNTEVATIERLNLLQSSNNSSDFKFERGGWI